MSPVVALRIESGFLIQLAIFFPAPSDFDGAFLLKEERVAPRNRFVIAVTHPSPDYYNRHVYFHAARVLQWR
jgi:hypothetical protein